MSHTTSKYRLRAPVNVTWEVTYGCNLSCIHCLSDSGKRRQDELNTAACLQLIDMFAKSQVFQLNIGGGEPFSRPDFIDLMDHAHSRGLVTCISTNATLLTDKLAQRLAHPLVYTQVSLDGAKPQTNDRIRGQGSYARILAGLELLRQQDIPVSINTVLTRHNFNELDELDDLARSLGAGLRVSRFRPSGRGLSSWKELNIEASQAAEFSDWLDQHPRVATGDSFFSVSSEERNRLGLNMCGAAKLTCCVSPRGDLYPCAFLQEDDFLAGRLPDQPLHQLWKDAPAFESLRQLEISSCESCHRLSICNGGCPAIAYHTMGSTEHPDPGCLAQCVKTVVAN